MENDRFTRPVVDVLAKRAGNICSNPDCMALTSGPSDKPDVAINIGEAAHIYGARPGSARFDQGMSNADRADIANSIWLCRNCHKKIDNDPKGFPADLLFEWRRSHERGISERLGKTGALLRDKILDRKLDEYPNCSYRAHQLIIDKPECWECKLTAELLRGWLEPLIFRWQALERGLYALHTNRLSLEEYLPWQMAKLASLTSQMGALTKLLNEELVFAWGPSGEPGSETAIYRSCLLMVEACRRILEWEEQVRFADFPHEFSEVKRLLLGVGGRQILQIFDIPPKLSAVVDVENPTGKHHLSIVFDLPDGWAKRFEDEFEKGRQEVLLRDI